MACISSAFTPPIYAQDPETREEVYIPREGRRKWTYTQHAIAQQIPTTPIATVACQVSCATLKLQMGHAEVSYLPYRLDEEGRHHDSSKQQ